MNNSLALVRDDKKSELTTKGRAWRETPITNDIIFHGKDACGRSGWFLRLTVSGLYPRRVGPYPTKTEALNVLEWFVTEVELEQFIELQNQTNDKQAYLVEGIPALKGR